MMMRFKIAFKDNKENKMIYLLKEKEKVQNQKLQV